MRMPRIAVLAATLALTVLMAGALTGCGETALEKAAQNIAANEALQDAGCIVGYDSEQDFLSVQCYGDTDLDTLFTTLNESIQDQEVGGLYFTDEGYINDYYYYLDDGLKDAYSEKIGGLTCSSIGTLALGGSLAEDSSGAWTAAAAKAGKVRIPNVWDVSGYEGTAAEGLKDIHVLWTESVACGGAYLLPNLEELAICDVLELNATPVGEEGAEAGSEDAADAEAEAGAEDGDTGGLVDELDAEADDADTAADDADATDDATADADATDDADAADDADAEGEETAGPMYEFDFDFDSSYDGFRYLKKAKNLQRILIAPSSPGWKLNEDAAGYVFSICNIRPDIMMNPPEEAYSEDTLVRADTIDVSLIDQPSVNDFGIEQEETLRTQIIMGFLDGEVEPCYKKGIKYKESSKDPKINGKSLVYIVDPYQYSENDWADKREYNGDGKLLLSEISGKIAVPEKSGDYDTFIYGYPTFKRVGSYTSGTKAYSQSYYVQVFDRKNRIAYEPQLVDTEQPENQFSYTGTAPDKHSGIVPEKDIIKFIKKL